MRRRLRRFLWATMTALLLAGITLTATNFGGWRARVVARVMRVENPPRLVTPPADFLPMVPQDFAVSAFAAGLAGPRSLALAPNGDVFVAESRAGRVSVLKHEDLQAHVDSKETFADDLNLPFGIVFLGEYVYIANTDELVRFKFDPATSVRVDAAERLLELPSGSGHWTRSLALSADLERLFVGVGSETNASVEADPRRASILSVRPDGTDMRIYASGLRNTVGMASHPRTGRLWAAVNERDDLGDDVPSDFFTEVVENGFYGWPYSYLGQHIDPRLRPNRELVAKAIAPDVLLGAHVAPVQVVFYDGISFPPEYRHGAFIAEHGSWNRSKRVGYQVAFVPFDESRPAGMPRPFLTGFVTDPAGKEVYGRPAGLTVTRDGDLLVSDDGTGVIWKVSYLGVPAQ